MATEKLYYSDPYLKEFSAHVIKITELEDGRIGVILDRTAFYPEGGGQPCDTGWLNDIPVIDVRSKDGDIVHVVSEAPSTEEVTGRLDWARRFDHMQQHSGEHVLSGSFLELFGAENVGFHLGPDAVYIDVTMESLTAEQAAAAEARANAAIYSTLTVSTHHVTDADLSKFPLRKMPTKDFGSLRLVEMPGIDCCPCGGTHVANTGQIGSIKIRGWERKSGVTRVDFVCGGRALADHGLNLSVVRQLSTRLSVPPVEVPSAVEKQLAKLEGLHKELQAAKQDLARLLAVETYGEAPSGKDGVKVIVKLYEGQPPIELADFAKHLLACGPAILLFAAGLPEENKSQFLFACTPGLTINTGALLKGVLPLVGGKGGGNANWAQGGGPFSDKLADALEKARLEVQGE